MQGEHSRQNSFFSMIYEDLVPANHLLRQLAAKVDLFRLPPPLPETPLSQAPEAPDPDARFGRKSATKSFYGYKEHLATDADSEIITAVTVTPGNVPDSHEFAKLVDHHAQEVTADKGYDTDANHRQLKRRGQRSSIIVKKNRTNAAVIGQANAPSQRERPKIERKFAEQKRYHGLGQARYWGLRKVTIQVLMVCIVVNCKRTARLAQAHCGPPGAAWCPVNETGR